MPDTAVRDLAKGHRRRDVPDRRGRCVPIHANPNPDSDLGRLATAFLSEAEDDDHAERELTADEHYHALGVHEAVEFVPETRRAACTNEPGRAGIGSDQKLKASWRAGSS